MIHNPYINWETKENNWSVSKTLDRKPMYEIVELKDGTTKELPMYDDKGNLKYTEGDINPLYNHRVERFVLLHFGDDWIYDTIKPNTLKGNSIRVDTNLCSVDDYDLQLMGMEGSLEGVIKQMNRESIINQLHNKPIEEEEEIVEEGEI